MKAIGRSALLLGGIAALFVLLGGCATVNRLGEYDVEGTSIAATMRVPPEPTVKVQYVVRYEPRDPLYTVMSIGTNIAKAAEAEQADERMREALANVDVPGIVQDEAFAACAKALDADRVKYKGDADYVLRLEIHEYGIAADSPFGAVSLRMRLTASLTHTRSSELVWRRSVRVDDPASPQMFGFPVMIGDVVTAGVLANLTTRQLERGFEQLAEKAGRSVARSLEEDLYRARYE